MDKVTHFEIPAGDMKQTQKFLKSMFGWQFEEWDEDYYHVMTTETGKNGMPKEKGAINGGLVKRESTQDRPLLVIEVASITRSLAKVKKAGGKVITDKQQAGEWGYWAEIADPDGNVYELWEESK